MLSYVRAACVAQAAREPAAPRGKETQAIDLRVQQAEAAEHAHCTFTLPRGDEMTENKLRMILATGLPVVPLEKKEKLTNKVRVFFAQFGEITWLEVPPLEQAPGASNDGYAMIEYRTPDSAADARSRGNGYKFDAAHNFVVYSMGVVIRKQQLRRRSIGLMRAALALLWLRRRALAISSEAPHHQQQLQFTHSLPREVARLQMQLSEKDELVRQLRQLMDDNENALAAKDTQNAEMAARLAPTEVLNRSHAAAMPVGNLEALEAEINALQTRLHQNLGVLREVLEARRDEDRRCIICMDAPKSIAFSCGHLATCIECSRTIEECPVCRAPITQRLAIFRS